LDQRLRLALVDEPARHDIRSRYRLAGLCVHRKHHHHDAVAREHLPVAQHDLPDVADPQPINIYIAAGRVVYDLDAALRRDLDDVAVLCYTDVFRWHTHALRYPRMLDQHANLAMDRHYVPWFQERQHQLDLLAAAMPGDVHLCPPLV